MIEIDLFERIIWNHHYHPHHLLPHCNGQQSRLYVVLKKKGNKVWKFEATEMVTGMLNKYKTGNLFIFTYTCYICKYVETSRSKTLPNESFYKSIQETWGKMSTFFLNRTSSIL